jgi:hypothetical protein
VRVAAMGCGMHLKPTAAVDRVAASVLCSPAPIDTVRRRGHAGRMRHDDSALDDRAIVLFTDSLSLLHAAKRLREHAHTRESASVLPLSLALVEETLYALAGACGSAADALIPPGDPREPVAVRFARARADWPAPIDRRRPSRELQAQILVVLQDTSAAMRAAGRRCGDAIEIVGPTLPSANDELDARLLPSRTA